MSEQITSLEDLGGAMGVAPSEGDAPVTDTAPVHVQKLDDQGRAYATGKRKDAIARVWVKPGSGQITVNGKDFSAYFARPVLQMIVQQPIVAAHAMVSLTSLPPSKAAVCPARPVLCVTAFPKRSPITSQICAVC
jgi:hypothetical protein